MKYVSMIAVLLAAFGTALLVAADEPSGEVPPPDTEAAAGGAVELTLEDACGKLVDEAIGKMVTEPPRPPEELGLARAALALDLSDAYRLVSYWQNRCALLREYMAALKNDREAVLKMVEKKEPLAAGDLKTVSERLKRARLSYLQSRTAATESLASLQKKLLDADLDIEVDAEWKLELPVILPADIEAKIEELAQFFTPELLGQEKAGCFGKKELQEINLKIKVLTPTVRDHRSFKLRMFALRDNAAAMAKGYSDGRTVFSEVQRMRADLLDAEDTTARTAMEVQTTMRYLTALKKIIESTPPPPEPTPEPAPQPAP